MSKSTVVKDESGNPIGRYERRPTIDEMQFAVYGRMASGGEVYLGYSLTSQEAITMIAEFQS